MSLQTITLRRPDDWHLHVRDEEVLHTVMPYTARRFGRAVIMPNLTPPVTDVDAAIKYRQRIEIALQDAASKTNDTSARFALNNFDAKMALYLTPATSIDTIREAAANPHIIGVKWYPTGATTNSEHGVHDITQCGPVLEAMTETGLPLLVHGEVTDVDVDTFDREARFIETVLEPLLARLPQLRVVLEHITTSEGIEFVKHSGTNVAGTLTPHHLLLNRTALFQGGLRPHHYCLPILKREAHRQALLGAATSGNESFFLGTDSAPHLQHQKENACGCAGIFSSHAGIELYAEAFDQVDRLDRLEGFASLHGPAFYGLAPNADSITLERSAWKVPQTIACADSQIIPFRAGHDVAWSIKPSS